MPGWRQGHKHSMDGKVSCGLRSVPSAASLTLPWVEGGQRHG